MKSLRHPLGTLLITNGDVRESANQKCWTAQARPVLNFF
jgi:hypothetical protein